MAGWIRGNSLVLPLAVTAPSSTAATATPVNAISIFSIDIAHRDLDN